MNLLESDLLFHALISYGIIVLAIILALVLGAIHAIVGLIHRSHHG